MHRFGFLFDIDGVFVRGKTIIDRARESFNLLQNRNGTWKVPVVFVTNAGNMLRKNKAESLSDLFKVHISPDQVVMSHSPLRMFHQFYESRMLVCGQGPVKHIASGLGFRDVVTIDELAEQFPNLDVCDHKRRKSPACAFEEYARPIDAILLFGEPLKWERGLQLLLDILMTDGQPYRWGRETSLSASSGSPASSVSSPTSSSEPTSATSASASAESAATSPPPTGSSPYPHPPVLACNMDFQWMAEAPLPRLSHGCFLHCLETLYERLSGHRLLYTALVGKPSEVTYNYAEFRLNMVARQLCGFNKPVQRIYCVGDNPQTDIYGANLYQRYLRAIQTSHKEQHLSSHYSASPLKDRLNFAASPSAPETLTPSSAASSSLSSTTPSSTLTDTGLAKSCFSILVHTGVFHKSNPLESTEHVILQDQLNHNHRDFPDYPQLKVPSFESENIYEAVRSVFERENLFLSRATHGPHQQQQKQQQPQSFVSPSSSSSTSSGSTSSSSNSSSSSSS